MALMHLRSEMQHGIILMWIKRHITALGNPDDPQDRDDSRDMGVPWH